MQKDRTRFCQKKIVEYTSEPQKPNDKDVSLTSLKNIERRNSCQSQIILAPLNINISEEQS